jgi:hypothetical protein
MAIGKINCKSFNHYGEKQQLAIGKWQNQLQKL